MKVVIKCETCGIEKELEIKVPRFCSTKCRMDNLRAKRIKKVDVNIQPEVPTTDTVLPPQETGGNTPVPV